MKDVKILNSTLPIQRFIFPFEFPAHCCFYFASCEYCACSLGNFLLPPARDPLKVKAPLDSSPSPSESLLSRKLAAFGYRCRFCFASKQPACTQFATQKQRKTACEPSDGLSRNEPRASMQIASCLMHKTRMTHDSHDPHQWREFDSGTLP